MKRSAIPAVAILSVALLAGVSGCGPERPDYGKDVLKWEQLPALPDPVGFAGAFAGASEDALIVAGGANFPAGRPWDGSPKVWHDRIFVLDDPEGPWQLASEKLPRPLAYGLSVSANNGVVCCGGGDAKRHYADGFLLRWDGGKILTHALPPMPRPAAFFCGAILGETLYVAGGLEQPQAPAAMKTFWALDLSANEKQRKWVELPPWPGPPRMLAVAAAQDGRFFLFSGVELVPGRGGKPTRRYLQDAYRFAPGFGWHRMADLPHPVAGAPTPALAWREKGILVLGGDDGCLALRTSALKDHHPGFTPQILGYCILRDAWLKMGRLLKKPGPNPARHPNAGVWPAVTTPAVPWRGHTVIPSGEARPGVRTPRVVWGRPIWQEPPTCPCHPVCWVSPLASRRRQYLPPWLPNWWVWQNPRCCP